MVRSISLVVLVIIGWVTADLEWIQELADELKLKMVRHKRQITLGFDAALQGIDVSGPHKFVPPGPGDQRGPCPGLNALANHNYLPHNGIATIAEFTKATNLVFGMGFDISLVLSVYGAIVAGDLVKWSIGGPDAEVSLGALLSQPQGISYSHNIYENDASATRGDLYCYGDASLLRMENFKLLYGMQNCSDANFNVPILNRFESLRIAHSRSHNPYFFYGPESGVMVANGAHRFIYRFMANKSAEFPEGKLDCEVLKSFYAISGDDDDLIYTPGHEEIPYNWYRRAFGDEYTLPIFLSEIAATGLEYPETIAIGGNTGTVNSFTGVDLSDLTGGVFNLATLFEGNNFVCFFVQVLLVGIPDVLKGAVTALFSILLSVFGGTYGTLTLDSCPQLTHYNTSMFSIYPGYTEFSNGTYPQYGNCTGSSSGQDGTMYPELPSNDTFSVLINSTL